MSTMRREYDDYEMESEYEEEGSEVEYEEEEDHKPNPEEAEYLELRERLKEQIRKKMKQESGSSITTSSSYSKISSSRNNNHGSFFGPSRRSISDRVIQESRSLLDNPDLANKVFKSNNPKPKSSSSGSASVGSKPRPNISAPKAINGVKKKVEILKTTRDYSFLLSDNAEMPAPVPVKERKPYQSVSAPAKDRRPIEDPRYAKSSQQRVRESVSESGRKVQENRDIRRFKPSSSNQGSSQGGGKLGQIAKQMSLNGRSLTDSRSKGNGPGTGPSRALVEKGVPSRIPQRKICAPEGRRVVEKGPTKMQVSVSKKPVMVQRRVVEEPYKPRPVQKQGVVSSSSKTSQIVRGSHGNNVSRMEVKRKPIRREEAPKRRYNDEDEEAMNMLRQMTQTRYDPRRYQDEDDDSDMEAGFDDILREEKRSERIGREEDEIQAKLIEEEERRERMRKEKKRKMR